MASPTLISNAVTGASGTTSASFASFTATAGATQLVFVSDTDGNTVSCSDSIAGSYTLVADVTTGGGSSNPRIWIFAKTNHPGGASCTITLTFNNSADPGMSRQEWTASTIDTGSLATSNTGSSPWTLTSNTLASSNSTMIFMAAGDAGGTVTYNEGTGFTKRTEQSNGNLYWTHGAFSLAVSATTAVGTSLTIDGGSSVGPRRAIFALTEAAGGSTITPAAGVATTSTLAGKSTAASTITAAAGAATTSAMVGSSTDRASFTSASGIATTSTMAGKAIVVSVFTAATGLATTSSMAGASTAASSLSNASGFAATSILTASALAAAAFLAAAGQATTSTLLSFGASTITPAAGTSTTSVLTSTVSAVASFLPAAGLATTATMIGSDASGGGTSASIFRPTYRPRRR